MFIIFMTLSMKTAVRWASCSPGFLVGAAALLGSTSTPILLWHCSYRCYDHSQTDKICLFWAFLFFLSLTPEPVLNNTLNRGIRTQSSRAAIQPGFLSSQAEKRLSPGQVRADFHLEDQETRLDYGPRGLCFDIPALNGHKYITCIRKPHEWLHIKICGKWQNDYFKLLKSGSL